mgnify:CR=1 FL=1
MMNKLDSPKFLESILSGFDGVFLVLKSAKVNVFIMDFYFCYPFISRFIESYANHSRGVINSNPTIPKIGRVSAYPKIARSVIKSISGYMIDIFSIFCARYNSMKFIQATVRESLLEIWTSALDSYAPFSTPITSRLHNFVSGLIYHNYEFSMSFTKNSDFHTVSL